MKRTRLLNGRENLIQLGVQSMVGLTTEWSVKLWDEVNGMKVMMMLINCGALLNFILHKVVEALMLETPKFV